jgi:hypothetical protein
MRCLALLVLFAVLPTVELAEQGIHVVEHLFAHEAPDHSAHHDEQPGDEHGCTGLVHLCGHHATQVTTSQATCVIATTETPELLAVSIPMQLFDLNAVEPPNRPPIA